MVRHHLAFPDRAGINVSTERGQDPTAVTEYTYTAEFTGASTTDGGVDVGQHLEGDFPGGVVDLNYRFTLDGAVIGRLVIEP